MIGILYNPRVAQARPLAEEMAAWIEQGGRQVRVCAADDASDTLCLQETGLLVTLGGDGSILRAARAAAPYGTLLLGVNLGRVGFLTEAEPGTWREVLARVLAGDYWVEERMMLRAVTWRGGRDVGAGRST